MSLESHATCMPGPWAERALSPREVPGTLPPPGTGWSRAGAGLLGWGQVCVIEARVASDVTASLDALLGELAAAGPWLGGWAFDLEQPPAGVWADFPLLRFVVPAVVLRWGGSAATLSWQSGAEDLAVEIQRAWDSPHAGGSPPRSTWALGNRAHWDALHARALDEVASGRLGKVVLARSVPGRSSATPLGAFLALARGNPGSRAFLFQCGAGTFVGASPEILCHV